MGAPMPARMPGVGDLAGSPPDDGDDITDAYQILQCEYCGNDSVRLHRIDGELTCSPCLDKHSVCCHGCQKATGALYKYTDGRTLCRECLITRSIDDTRPDSP